MRSLVHSGQRCENKIRPFRANLLRNLAGNVFVDCEPPANLPAEVSCARPGDEPEPVTDSATLVESAVDDVQRADAGRNEIEHRLCGRIHVAIDESHLRPDVTPRMPGKTRRSSFAIVPAKS